MLFVLGAHDGASQLVAGQGIEAAGVEHTLPEVHVVVIEGTKSPEIVGVDVPGCQLFRVEEPAGVAIAGARHGVGGVERARPKAEVVGGAAVHIQAGAVQEDGIDFL